MAILCNFTCFFLPTFTIRTKTFVNVLFEKQENKNKNIFVVTKKSRKKNRIKLVEEPHQHTQINKTGDKMNEVCMQRGKRNLPKWKKDSTNGDYKSCATKENLRTRRMECNKCPKL